MNIFGVMTIGENITSESPIGERVTTGLEVMLIGMSVVFGVLVLLMAILYIFKAFALKNSKTEEPVKVPEPAQANANTASAAGSDEDTLVAAVTAAIAAARGESDCAFNVISIKKIVK